jgi:hypothetical protein
MKHEVFERCHELEFRVEEQKREQERLLGMLADVAVQQNKIAELMIGTQQRLDSLRAKLTEYIDSSPMSVGVNAVRKAGAS